MGPMLTRMRTILAIFVAPLSSSIPGQTVEAAQQTDSNLMCIERMELPSYPPLAQSARISGTVKVEVLLSPAGSVQDVNVRADPQRSTAGKGILEGAVANSIRLADFDRNCGGKHVRVEFVFELAGTSMGRPKQSVSFGSPNRFLIKSEAPHFQP